MEASALHAPAAVARKRASLRAPLLRLRSDEQLVALFRAGHDEAFRVIHDRYRQRLFGYVRQMLPCRQDAEDALQDVFVRAYAGLRTTDRKLALRAWLYRVAHNRCIDELRRPSPPPPDLAAILLAPIDDPIARVDQRELLRRLVDDIRRLPGQQRSALLLRELDGMPYADVAAVLELSVPAVKSLLVRARTSLTRALEARDTACAQIRDELALAHDRGVRPGAAVRCHLRDCDGCREFRRDLRSVSRRVAALVPTLGPVGALANLFGLGGGAGSGAAAGGGGAAVSGAASTGGTLGAVGGLAGGAGHVATLIAATVVTAGGALEIHHSLSVPPHGQALHVAPATASRHVPPQPASPRRAFAPTGKTPTLSKTPHPRSSSPAAAPVAGRTAESSRPQPGNPHLRSIPDATSKADAQRRAAITDTVPIARPGDPAVATCGPNASVKTCPADGGTVSGTAGPASQGSDNAVTGSVGTGGGTGSGGTGGGSGPGTGS